MKMVLFEIVAMDHVLKFDMKSLRSRYVLFNIGFSLIVVVLSLYTAEFIDVCFQQNRKIIQNIKTIVLWEIINHKDKKKYKKSSKYVYSYK